MKKPIATEQIFSPLGHRTAVKYHFEDGSSRTITHGERRVEAMQTVHKIIEKFNKQNKD